MNKYRATFANFINRYGDEVLIDHLLDIVIPAFVDDSLVKSYGANTNYYLYNIKVQDFSDDMNRPEVAIFGQYVKDTILSRTQIFNKKNGLVNDTASLQSSPSAFFVLMLSNHRLIYMPETQHAPSITSFKNTMRSFFYKKWDKNIRKLKKENDLNPDTLNVTLKDYRSKFSAPTLEIVPLTGFDSIEDFVGNFSKLKKIDIRVLTPNPDVDGQQLFDVFREKIEPLGPERSVITVANSKGLDKNEVVNFIKDATEAGNQDVRLAGLDENNAKLSGDNDNFKVSVEVQDLPIRKADVAKKLLLQFESLRRNGTIKSPVGDDGTLEIINRFRNQLNDND